MCQVVEVQGKALLIKWVALKRAVVSELQWSSLTAEAVQGASLPFQRIDDVHGGDGLPFGVLGVSDGIPDDVLQEHFKNTASLFIDETRDALHASTTSQAADCGLCNALDVVAKNLAVALGAAFSKSFSSLTLFKESLLIRIVAYIASTVARHCPHISNKVPSPVQAQHKTKAHFFKTAT